MSTSPTLKTLLTGHELGSQKTSPRNCRCGWATAPEFVDLGRSLGLRVVAEGVETVEAHERLAAMGCDQGQGYFYSRPIPSEEFERWLERGPALGGATVTPIAVDRSRSAAAA
jgi:hypothetical protein